MVPSLLQPRSGEVLTSRVALGDTGESGAQIVCVNEYIDHAVFIGIVGD